jgi:hypothetical protein
MIHPPLFYDLLLVSALRRCRYFVAFTGTGKRGQRRRQKLGKRTKNIVPRPWL